MCDKAAIEFARRKKAKHLKLRLDLHNFSPNTIFKPASSKETMADTSLSPLESWMKRYEINFKAF